MSLSADVRKVYKINAKIEALQKQRIALIKPYQDCGNGAVVESVFDSAVVKSVCGSAVVLFEREYMAYAEAQKAQNAEGA